MNQSSQNEWFRVRKGKRHEFERTRFRTFLFQMCGSCELVKFWLRVEPSWHSLNIFHDILERHPNYSNDTQLEMAVQRMQELDINT